MCLRFCGRFKRFAAVGGSDGVLRGFGEWLEEDARGRFCILNRRNYTRNGHDWNPMPDMELESLRGGGSYFWKRGSPRGGEGFGRTPRTPLVTGLLYHHHVPFWNRSLSHDPSYQISGNSVVDVFRVYEYHVQIVLLFFVLFFVLFL